MTTSDDNCSDITAIKSFDSCFKRYYPIFFFRCSLCRSVVDSYDSLNAKYGENGQVLFTRVNVEEMKVSDVRLTFINMF